MAEVTPGCRGTTISGMASSWAMSTAYIGPAPPKGQSANIRVVAPFNRDEPYALHEIVDRVTQDGISSVDNRNAKRRGDPFLNRPLCGGTIQFPAIPFPPEVRVEAAEQELRIGGCRLCSAVPVADRTGIAPAPAGRPAATRVDPGDRTSARAERVDIDCR